MKKKMLFAALAGVMMAIGLLVIAKMNKNPSSERETAMNNERPQLSKACSRLLDVSIKSNVLIVLDR